jgi:antitoxin component YwqK of YwqJK toxin-antitoxin module
MKRLPLVLFLSLFIIVSCSREKRVVEESYPDGSPKKVCLYTGSGEDKQLLRETTYYPSGKLQMDGTYKNNKRDGQWIYWYENGSKWSEGSFREGKNEGKRLTYFENGKVRYEAYYSEGIRVGIWKFFDDKGKLLQEINYSAVDTLTGPSDTGR